MVASVRRHPHECTSSQFPAWTARGKGTSVPLLIKTELLALGNSAKSPEQGDLCGVGRTTAFKRFRSAPPSTFLPSPWQQARRGGIWLLGNSYSCKDDSKLWLQISLFPREETEYTSRKKACLETREEVAIAFASGSSCHCFNPCSPTSGCQLHLLLWHICLPSIKVSLWSQVQQISECNRCIPGGTKTYVSTEG